MSLPRIYLCGPIAGVGEPARGGFQACNRRTIDALRLRGVDVVELPFPHPKVGGWRKWVQYATGFLALYARVLRCERGSIFHLTALGSHFTWFVWPLAQCARLAGCTLVFDIRAGVAQRNYDAGGALFRAVYAHSLRSADEVMVEGETYLPFVTAIVGRTPYYLANHIDVEALPARQAPGSVAARLPEAPAPRRVLTIVHVGRLVPEKGIGIVVDACLALQAAGEAVRLRVAGAGEPAYLEQLRAQARDLDVQWLGPQPSAKVLELFAEADVFLFPTSHHGEGQSNALTEALACGCVPIASAHGFNAEVIGTAGVTLPPGSPAQAYADAVRHLWHTPGAWDEASRAARQRAGERFATGPVVERLVDQYRRLAAR